MAPHEKLRNQKGYYNSCCGVDDYLYWITGTFLLIHISNTIQLEDLKVVWIHYLGTMSFSTNCVLHCINLLHWISDKLWPVGGARWKGRDFPNSVGFLGTMKACKTLNENPSNGCWDISVQFSSYLSKRKNGAGKSQKLSS